MDCELCDTTGGELLWQDDFCHIVLVPDAHYAGFCRVILNRHIKDMTDLSETERSRLMNTVFAVEAGVRETIRPDKINLASLGNMTPHLHWHVIPRFEGDRHYPNSIWGEPLRKGGATALNVEQLRQAIHARIGPGI